ncbi:MAG: TIGR00282 family metallophosphoesterase [Pseudomonadota bacterium]
MINVLFLGDVFGRPGRRLARELLPALVTRHSIDLVVANGENASGGIGLTVESAKELFSAGIDVLTSGNHIFKHREILEYLNQEKRLVRPANYPEPVPGRGGVLVETPGGVKVGVVNVLGRIFMAPLDCPFRAADREIERLKALGARVILVDVHAEASSEKKALAWHLDGRASAVLGTHTHVQTADETIMPGGTAYITDLGMTGPHQSVIGMKKEAVLEGFLTGRPQRFEPAKKGLRLEGVAAAIDPATGQAKKIVRIQEVIQN